MAGQRKGIYFNGQEHVSCLVKRAGSQNHRIILEDGTEKLVAADSVKVQDAPLTKRDTPERLIPTTPLEKFYRSLRTLTGSQEAKFQSLCNLLNERHGPNGSMFLAELFRRSIRHAEFYSNIEEGFYPARPTRNSNESPFAKRLVEKMSESKTMQLGNNTFVFLDYEIFPFRTTYSCLENGKPASRSGSGGMDLLLALK